jgi:hypothetical protein
MVTFDGAVVEEGKIKRREALVDLTRAAERM